MLIVSSDNSIDKFSWETESVFANFCIGLY